MTGRTSIPSNLQQLSSRTGGGGGREGERHTHTHTSV